MRDNYDFSKSIKNPYVRMLKQQITIRISCDTVDYFKKLATETGVPYQTLMDLYLSQCAREKRKLRFDAKP